MCEELVFSFAKLLAWDSKYTRALMAYRKGREKFLSWAILVVEFHKAQWHV